MYIVPWMAFYEARGFGDCLWPGLTGDIENLEVSLIVL